MTGSVEILATDCWAGNLLSGGSHQHCCLRLFYLNMFTGSNRLRNMSVFGAAANRIVSNKPVKPRKEGKSPGREKHTRRGVRRRATLSRFHPKAPHRILPPAGRSQGGLLKILTGLA